MYYLYLQRIYFVKNFEDGNGMIQKKYTSLRGNIKDILFRGGSVHVTGAAALDFLRTDEDCPVLPTSVGVIRRV